MHCFLFIYSSVTNNRCTCNKCEYLTWLWLTCDVECAVYYSECGSTWAVCGSTWAVCVCTCSPLYTTTVLSKYNLLITLIQGVYLVFSKTGTCSQCLPASTTVFSRLNYNSLVHVTYCALQMLIVWEQQGKLRITCLQLLSCWSRDVHVGGLVARGRISEATDST